MEVLIISDFSATPSAISFTLFPNFCISAIRTRMLESISFIPLAKRLNSSLRLIRNSCVRSPSATLSIPLVMSFTVPLIPIAILLPMTKAITEAKMIIIMLKFLIDRTSLTILSCGIKPQSIIPVFPIGAYTYKYFSPSYSTYSLPASVCPLLVM